jgi:hypothetical protein
MNIGSNNKVIMPMKGKSAFLFLIAILMLVVSCPFKRLLQAENNIQAFAQQSTKWNNTISQGITSNSSSCCSQKLKTTLVNPDKTKQQLTGPDIVSTRNLQTGFTIHYFLSGAERLYKPFPSSSVSSLPLFLQHCRLLI